jgi:hypothetical protein
VAMMTTRDAGTPTLVVRVVTIVVVATAMAATAISGQRPHFFPDDPIVRVPESQDASGAQVYEIDQMYEMVYNLFVAPGYQPSGLRAGNINTIDEVPDSSWFTNRIGATAISDEDLVRGPNVGAPPDPSKWVLTREKTSGAHPGFTARDATGETFFLEFDPTYYPEGATAAVAIASKIFWALGYNQVESYLSTFDPKNVTFDPRATVKRPSGARTPFTNDDLNEILERVARNKDGTYRVIAGRLIPGKIIGNFLYAGTRSDDPNDLVPHERRRELRALRVFGAWTNLTDLKAANTLDALATKDGHTIVKHYLQDVGSTFGMCNEKYEWDLSWERFYQGDTTLKRLFSLGFALSTWQTVPYEEYPSVGKFEGERFDPRLWQPQTMTLPFLEMRDDDAFWAARRVVAFTDDMIRTVVHTGQFSDPEAEKHLADVLIKRRDTIARVYLAAVNPIVDPRLSPAGQLQFENAAVAAHVADAPAAYHAVWSHFDNATGETRQIAETQSTTTTMQAPAGVPTGADRFIEVRLWADSAQHPVWHQPIHTYFRREASGWKLVGLERMPAGPATVESGSTE